MAGSFYVSLCLSSVGRSYHRKKFRTTSMALRKIIFGKQLSFNLTKRNIEKQIGIILRLSFKSLF